MWNKGWDNVFRKNEWGKYPPEDLIRFMAKNFNNSINHKSIEVLEVGCGTGANIWFLAREGYTTTGIDGSKVAIDIATKRLKEEGVTASLFVGDIIQLPFENESFDCVIDNECIYANSLEDTHKIFKEIKRVLKNNGMFYSKTFKEGSYGYGKGKRYKDERHTFLKLSESTSKEDYGIIRFTSEYDINNVYGRYFKIKNYEYVIRSIQARSYEISEWVISCSKNDY